MTLPVKGFQKGNTLGGRKQMDAELKKSLEEKGKEALEKLYWFMNNAESEEIRYKATKDIVERAFGKPAQPIGNENSEPLLIKWAL